MLQKRFQKRQVYAKNYCKADYNNVHCFFVTIFRLAIPAFLGFQVYKCYKRDCSFEWYYCFFVSNVLMRIKKNRNSFFTQSSRGSAGLERAKWPGENWKPYFLSFPPSTQFHPWLAFFVRFASFPRSRTFTSRPYIPYSKWLSGKGTHMAADNDRPWGIHLKFEVKL